MPKYFKAASIISHLKNQTLTLMVYQTIDQYHNYQLFLRYLNELINLR